LGTHTEVSERLVNSGPFTGMGVDEAREAITAFAAELGFGGPETQVHMRMLHAAHQLFRGC
jgi:hypothetical protein